MPYINVTMSGKSDRVLSARIAEQVSQLTKAHLRKDPTITSVVVNYQDPEHWFVGGKSLSDQGKNSFWLDIKVVDGTNTKTELAAYQENVFAALSATLGSMHGESYILVHEVPAAAYGFGGKTQEYRFIAGRMQPIKERAFQPG